MYIRVLAALVLFVAVSVPAWSAPTFSTFAGPSAGSDFGGCPFVVGTSSVTYGPCQDAVGLGDATASAQVGHLGVTIHETSTGFSFMSGRVGAEYSDTVVFSGPSTQPINAGIRLSYGGLVNSDNGGAQIDFSVAINGVFVGRFHELVANGVVVDCTINLGGGLTNCGTALNGVLITGVTSVPVGTEVGFVITMEGSAGGGAPGGNASVEWANSLDFIKGADLFVLPTGYTANQPSSFIVDNRFVPPTNGVPEPATLALFGVGLVGAALVRRRDRKHAA